MNRVYLVRHGENTANVTQEISYRAVDYSLTPKGVLQAEQTAEALADKDIHAIYSSPLKRTRETAAAISARVGVPVIEEEAFREIDAGEYEGRSDSVAWGEYFRILEQWFRGNSEETFPGGENYVQLLARMRAGLLKALEGRDGQNIVVVGHGGIFTVTMKDICQDVDIMMLVKNENHNCSISELEVTTHDGQLEAKLISWASFSHLHGAAAEVVAGVPAVHTAEQRAQDESL